MAFSGVGSTKGAPSLADKGIAGSGITDTRIADTVIGCGDGLHDGSRTGLFVNIAFVIAFAQRFILEETVSTGNRVTAVQLNRFACPTAGQTRFAPGGNVRGITAFAGG